MAIAGDIPNTTSSLAILRQLEWRVRHAVENVLSGEYRSALRGRGMEFDQVVRYEFGDDVRDIDWNVTARLGEPYRKKFIEEREVTVLVLFEDTTSLQFGSGAVSKRDALLELAGLVMMLGAVNRDRVGCIHVTPGRHYFREPVRSRSAIMYSAATLLASPPPAMLDASAREDLSNQPGEIPWSLISRAAPKHSVLIWLGDFAPRPTPPGWPVFSRRYQTMGFRIDDPWEQRLPCVESFAAFDATQGRMVTLDGSTDEQEAHAVWRFRRDESWIRHFPDSKSRMVVSTNDNRLDALVKFFRSRMRTHR